RTGGARGAGPLPRRTHLPRAQRHRRHADHRARSPERRPVLEPRLGMGQHALSGDSSLGTAGARLVAVGGSTPREYRLRAGKTSIGYAKDNDIVLDASTVSRYHAVIQRRIGGYTLTDLESTNGTFVNGLRIKNPTRLKRGDNVRFGDAHFAFLARRRSIIREFRSIRPFPLALITVFLFLIGFGVVRYRVWKAAKLGVTSGEP